MEPRQLLVPLLLATLATRGLTCPDIRFFVAPCKLSHFGTPISKEVAQSRMSQVLTERGLSRLSFGTGFHSLPLLLLDNPFIGDICEIPLSESCNVLECLDCEGGSGRRKLLQCLPYFGCFISAAPPNPQFGCIELEIIKSTVVVCVGDDCTAFTGEYSDVILARNMQCGEPAEEKPECSRTIEICAEGEEGTTVLPPIRVPPSMTIGPADVPTQTNPLLGLPIPDVAVPIFGGLTQKHPSKVPSLGNIAVGSSDGKPTVPVCVSEVQAQCCNSDGVGLCECEQCPDSSYLRAEKDGVTTLIATGSLSFAVCACL